MIWRTEWLCNHRRPFHRKLNGLSLLSHFRSGMRGGNKWSKQDDNTQSIMYTHKIYFQFFDYCYCCGVCVFELCSVYIVFLFRFVLFFCYVLHCNNIVHSVWMRWPIVNLYHIFGCRNTYEFDMSILLNHIHLKIYDIERCTISYKLIEWLSMCWCFYQKAPTNTNGLVHFLYIYTQSDTDHNHNHNHLW